MKVLLWDFDNTLGYRLGAWSGTVLEVLNNNVANHKQHLDTIRPFLQSGFPWHNHHIVRQANISPSQWWKELNPVLLRFFDSLEDANPQYSQFLVEQFKTTYLNSSQWRLFPKAIETVRECSNLGFRNVMLTNNVPEIETIFDSLGLSPYFDTIWNSAKLGVEKPNPKIFEVVIEHYGLENISYMIGDSVSADLEGSMFFGIPCILIGKVDSRATHSITEINQVLECLSTQADIK